MQKTRTLTRPDTTMYVLYQWKVKVRRRSEPRQNETDVPSESEMTKKRKATVLKRRQTKFEGELDVCVCM